MAWSRFEPGFTRHPKRLKCGPLPSWLWICSVDHCTVYRTDGFLESASVPALVPGLSPATLKKSVAVLLDVGSWEETAGGYQVHGYLEHNLSKAQVAADQAASRGRYARWKAGSNGVGTPQSNAVSNGAANAATTPRSTDLSVSQSVSKTKVKDVDSDVGGTARASTPERPGSESAPGVLDGKHPSRRRSSGSGQAVSIGAILGTIVPPPAMRYAEILERVKAEQPDLTADEQEKVAMAECQRQAKGAPR